MNEVAGILAVAGTALLSGSSIALRLDRTLSAQDDVDPLNYCEAAGDVADPAGDNTADAPTGLWPHPEGAAAQLASSSYSDGNRLARNTGSGLISALSKPVPKAPALSAGDLRRIRRRIRRDTRPARTPRAKVVRLAAAIGLAIAITSGVHTIIEGQQEGGDCPTCVQR